MAPRWQDPDRWLWPLSAALPWLAAVQLLQFARTGAEAWLWILPVWIHAVIPALDAWIGEDRRNPPESELRGLEGSRAVPSTGCWSRSTCPGSGR